ncbi:MAG: AmmeMemoRadiSam system protein B, partial [Desulfobulbus propionicus]
MRQPVVAGRFYPSDPQELQQTVAQCIPNVTPAKKLDAKAVIMPHAGYVYSGGVAGVTISTVNVPETVIILGPNHHGRGAQIALSTEDWQMPMGQVPVEQTLAQKILKNSILIAADETAHAAEHSLEVQVPFLQHEQEKLTIVPICIAHLSYEQCQIVAQELFLAI